MLVLAALAGCAPAAVVPPPRPAPACFDQLSRRGVAFEVASAPAAVRGCGLAGEGVRVSALAARFDKPAEMTCDMALKLDDFERVVQDAALRYFHRRVIAVDHLGAYSCRNINGTHRLSQHAHGQAIDIAAFELEGGVRISVKQHWRGADARSAFLREVAKDACRIFSVVLTPRSNPDHRDHLHLDLGPHPLCEA